MIQRYFLLSLAVFTLCMSQARATEEQSTNSNLNSRPIEATPKTEKSFFDLFRGDDAKPAEAESAKPAQKPVEQNAKELPTVKPNGAKAAAQQAPPAEEKPASLTNEQRELMRVQYYLNSLSTIVADFTQIAPDGGLTSGKFFLKRPGKLRWEYAPPTPILIISNGKSLVYYDKELEQVSHIPLDSTLAGFLAQDRIDLNDPDLKVDALSTAQGVLRLKLSKRKSPEEGSLLLEFSDQPLQIRNMVITDEQKQVTTVSLNKAQFGLPLENSLFVWKDPRKHR